MNFGFQAQKQPKANGVLKYFFTKRREYYRKLKHRDLKAATDPKIWEI